MQGKMVIMDKLLQKGRRVKENLCVSAAMPP